MYVIPELDIKLDIICIIGYRNIACIRYFNGWYIIVYEQNSIFLNMHDHIY